jgi:hypothetical protein
MIKPHFNTEEIELAGGIEVLIDTSYEVEKHAVTTGEVFKAPENIFFSYKSSHASSDFDVDMELKFGDKVYFHYLSCANAMKNNRFYECEGEYYILIQYHSMYVAKRGDDIVMLNGWMLMEPIYVDTFESSVITKTDMSKDKTSSKYAKVSHIGNPVRNYLRYKDVSELNIKVKAGDIVMYDPHSDIPLQYAFHADLDGKKRFFRMQRKDITGILTGTDEEILELMRENN